MAAFSRFSIEASARQWHALAERRVAAYLDMYRSGRWRHYYASQEEFAARMLDVIKVAKAFQQISGGPAPVLPDIQDVFREAA
ncbi:hypothetical protein [Pseudolabrys taiwanensis]|nr:hypothetical protein [Pseudolabrys taiwanensis]